MKNKVILIAIFLFTVINVYAQDDSSPIVKFLIKNGYAFPDSTTRVSVIPGTEKKWPDTIYYNTVYKCKLMRTPTIPISFSKFEYQNGQYQVVPVVSAGYGYTWFKGNVEFDEDDNIIINPGLYWGAIADVGLQSNFKIGNLSLNPYKFLGNIFAGGFVGFGAFSVFVGYDFVSHAPSLYLGGRIDLYTINKKYLRLLTKVRSARKRHKIIVPPVTIDD